MGPAHASSRVWCRRRWWWVLTEAKGTRGSAPRAETRAVPLPGAAVTIVWDGFWVSELGLGLDPKQLPLHVLHQKFHLRPGGDTWPPVQLPGPTVLTLRGSVRGVGHQPCPDLVGTRVSSSSSSGDVCSAQCPAARLSGYQAGWTS